MLQTIASSQRTSMCIDAMDECAAVHRAKLLDSMKHILEKSPGTRTLVTGRPHIRAEMEKRLAGRVRSVSVIPSQDDIVRYLRARFEEDETPDAMDESLEADILQRIPENISKMFLLVSLNIWRILRESTIYRRREKLNKMTDGLGLGDAYGATIERIKAQGGDRSGLGISALMWITHAERPLRADELCHALAVELGSTDFNTGNIPSMSTVVNCCQGLITVDKEASAVRLIHLTLQEYLSAHPDIFSRPHSTMAEMFLTYLNSKQKIHAKRELSDCATSLALVELLQEPYGQILTKSLLAQAEHFHWKIGTWSPLGGLHCASFFGIVEVVSALIKMGCGDINGGDFLGYTPLVWAAYNGHEDVVKALLGQKEVNSDKSNNDGRTPLSFAAGGGHEEVVKTLLKLEGVNPDKPNNDGQTPLSFAAWDGHEGVVKILLGRGEVDPDKPSNYGTTPLSYAAWNGHQPGVKMLLTLEGVNSDRPNNYGLTPLSFAAMSGHEGVVKILLGRKEVDPDKPSELSGTPLSLAAENGHEAIVKILLGREEVSPDKPNHNGQAPLSCAALIGHEGVVKILLRQKEVNPDKLDNSGNTPLSIAAMHGHERVVALLQSRKSGDPIMI